MTGSGFTEGIYQPLHVPDDPEPEPVPLQAYFHAEGAPPSRNVLPPRVRSAAVEIIRRRARGPHG